MTTLVSGATGFVGSHVVRRLIAHGSAVRALVRPSSRLAALEGLPVEIVAGDLRDRPSLARACRGIHQVFHVAADYRLWARDPREIYESNVNGTRNLVAAAQVAGVQRFVYTSTVATMAVPREGALPSEQTAAKLDEMIGHYKRSKFLAEQEVVAAANNGFPAVIVNPTAPVGPGDWRPTPTGRIILDFLQGRMPAYVDTGLNVVAVEDVAEGHWLAAERGRVGQRYILGGRNMTLKEILSALASITGRRAPWVRLPHAAALCAAYVSQTASLVTHREPQIPLEGVRMSRHKMFVETSKAERELGFVAEPVEQALERAVRWYEENGYVRASSRHAPKEVQTENGSVPSAEAYGANR